MRNAIAGIALLALGAGSLPAQEQAHHLVGSYTYSTTAPDGITYEGVIDLMQENGVWTGTLTFQEQPVPLTSVQLEGDELTAYMMLPDGEVTIRVTFEGDQYTGTWYLGMDSGEITGQRVTESGQR